jgi:hypothetical protein
VLASIFLLPACGDEKAPKPAAKDPKRCDLKDLGEAANLIESGKIPDDQLARVSGIGDPRSLVWQDKVTSKTFVLTRVMGTQRRLLFLEELPPGQAPTVKAVFEGHLLRWDKLPPQRAVPIGRALKKEYEIDIDATKTYLIIAGAKPEGCP